MPGCVLSRKLCAAELWSMASSLPWPLLGYMGLATTAFTLWIEINALKVQSISVSWKAVCVQSFKAIEITNVLKIARFAKDTSQNCHIAVQSWRLWQQKPDVQERDRSPHQLYCSLRADTNLSTLTLSKHRIAHSLG